MKLESNQSVQYVCINRLFSQTYLTKFHTERGGGVIVIEKSL